MPRRRRRRKPLKDNDRQTRSRDQDNDRQTRNRDLRRGALATLALISLSALAYAPVRDAGYAWDDEKYLVKNPMISAADGLQRIWFEPGSYRVQYYPVTFTTFWIEHRLWGFDARGYHLVNVAIHAINAVLLWMLLRALGVPGALLAAALFAVHPVNVESVVWIAERKNVLSGFFFLLTLLGWRRYLQAPRPANYLVTLVAYLLGMLSKTVLGPAPLVLGLVSWWQGNRGWKRLLAELTPFVAIAVTMSVVTVWRENVYTAGAVISKGLSPLDSVRVAGAGLVFYVWKIIWPFNMMAIYPRWDLAAWFFVFPLIVAVGLAGLWLARRRIGKGPVVAVLAFAIMHAPTLGFVHFGFMGHSWVADHFQYIPSMAGLALLAAVLTLAVRRLRVPPRHAAAACGVLMVAALGVLTYRYAVVWRNTKSFWSYNAAKNPTHTALSALGYEFYFEKDKYDKVKEREQYEECARKAEQYQRESIAIKDSPRARFRLGQMLMERKGYDEALMHFHRAREINYTREHAMEVGLLFSIGSAYWGKRDWAKCAEYWQMTLDIEPGMKEAQEWLPKARQRLKRASPPSGDGR